MASAVLSPGGYVRQGQRGSSPPRSVNVQVAVRCRPLNDREKGHGERAILNCSETRREVIFSTPGATRKNIASTQSANGSNGKKTFTYDQVFGPDATQADVYERVIEPIVDEVLQGYNCTVFAYGQTGTGKTHTMEGRRDESMVAVEERRLAANAGIIPRAVKQVFDHLRSLTDEHSVRVSHLELYNEQLTDLLSPDEVSTDSLRVYEDPQKGTFVQGLDDMVVRSEEDIFAVLDKSALKRKTAETLMNKYSSRSHSIFSITIHIKESTPDGTDLLKTGKLNLVDLAGSENVGRSGAVKGRAREAGNINQSLLTLGRVITALVDRHPHIPYRDSKLTRLLQESLGGRNKTCVIATVTPGSSSFEETASTLDYAYRAKSIKNRPTVNQMIAKHVLLKEYTEEISKLKKELDATRTKNGVYLPPDEYQKLQFTAQQQREEISQLESRGEDNLKKLKNLKEKLVKTQDALSRDQKILNETRVRLTCVNEELDKTKSSLLVALQQKEENGFLLRNHVKTEDDLFNSGMEMQSTLTSCVSDVSALHRRVDVKKELEKGNLRNLSVLKSTVESSVVSITSSLKKHQEDQESFLADSSNSLQKATTTLEEELSSMSNKMETLWRDIAEHDKENSTSVSMAEKRFQAKSKAIHEDISKVVCEQTSVQLEKKRAILDFCKGIYDDFAKSRKVVTTMQSHIKAHSNLRVKKFGDFADEQKQVLATLNVLVSENVTKQANVLLKMQEEQENEGLEDMSALGDAKSRIIKTLSSTLDSIISEGTDRVARKRKHLLSHVTSLSQQSESIGIAVQEVENGHSNGFSKMETNMQTESSQLDEQISNHVSSHEGSLISGAGNISAVGDRLSELAKSFQESSSECTAKLAESTALCSQFSKTADAHRAERSEKLESRLDCARNSTEETKSSVSSLASDMVSSIDKNLSTLRLAGSSFESCTRGKLESDVLKPVRAHEVCCDADHDGVPEKREWPAFSSLRRTRGHRSLIKGYRKEKSLQNVAIDDFGYVGEEDDSSEDEAEDENDEGDTDILDDSEVIGNASTSEPESLAESGESGRRDNGVDEETNGTKEGEKSLSPSSSHGSLSRQVEEVILLDSTNRRTRIRTKKLEHIIRKKPSSIPVPRTRSSSRKAGL